MSDKRSLPSQAKSGDTSVRPKRARGMPVFSKPDTRPDPAVLTADERMAEFGRLLARAIERRAAKRQDDSIIICPDTSKTQQ